MGKLTHLEETEARTEAERIAFLVIGEEGLRRVRLNPPVHNTASYRGTCPHCEIEDVFKFTISIPRSHMDWWCQACTDMSTATRPNRRRSYTDYNVRLHPESLHLGPSDFLRDGEYVFPLRPPLIKHEIAERMILSIADREGYVEPGKLYRADPKTVGHISPRTFRGAFKSLGDKGLLNRLAGTHKPNGDFAPVIYVPAEDRELSGVAGFDYDKYVPEGVKAGVE